MQQKEKEEAAIMMDTASIWSFFFAFHPYEVLSFLKSHFSHKVVKFILKILSGAKELTLVL